MGHFDQAGRLFVEGRDDDMIVSGGENVFPDEVEDLLARHLEVADVAVVGVPDETFGQRLRAYVVLRPGASVTPEDLMQYVGSQLARYKVPREVILTPEIPRNAAGKIMRRAME
jgi:fatty-acyl-CoA synthase